MTKRRQAADVLASVLAFSKDERALQRYLTVPVSRYVALSLSLSLFDCTNAATACHRSVNHVMLILSGAVYYRQADIFPFFLPSYEAAT